MDDRHVRRGDLQRIETRREAGGTNKLKSQIPNPNPSTRSGLSREPSRGKHPLLIALTLVVVAGSVSVLGQGRGAAAPGRAGGPPPSARATAPFDPTGYWVAVISAGRATRV